GGAVILPGGGVAAVDPRSEKLGVRALAPRETAENLFNLPAADFADYDRLRLALGVPDGARDLVAEKSIALENNMDALGALSWDKGCYMGQELTARTKYRGLVKKRLVTVRVEGDLPPAGTPVLLGEQEAGELRSGRDGLALALLRVDSLESAEKDGALVAVNAKLYLS
nr:tRNA-modifying protein YgfZ [Azospirillaceae bacterium]